MDDKTWCFKQATIDLIEEVAEWIKKNKEDGKEEENLLKEQWSGGKEEDASLQIGQLNCRKSQYVLEHLLKRVDIEGAPLDILLLSEPPFDINKGTIKCAEGLARIYHYRLEGRNERYYLWAAIIVLNNSLDIRFKPEWAGPFTVSIMVKVRNRKEIRITSVYNRVGSPEAALEIESILKNRRKLAIVGGDFNVHLRKWNKNAKVSRQEEEFLMETMNGPNWRIINTPGTHTWEDVRDTKTSQTTIDYSMVTKDMESNITNWKSIKIQKSDHRLLTFTVKHVYTLSTPRKYMPSNARLVRKISPKMGSIESMESLIQIIKQTKDELSTTTSSGIKWLTDNNLVDTLKETKKEIRHLERKKEKGQFIKTIERDIRRLRRREEEIRSQMEEEINVRINEKMKQEIRRNPWKKAPIGKHTPTQLYAIEKDGKMITDREQMANLIMEALHKDQEEQETNWSNEDILKCPEGPPLTRQEFIEATRSLKNNKASGIDGCSIKLVKMLVEKWPDVFYNWYKQIYQKGTIPGDWKITKLVAVAKSKFKCPKVDEFRPIGISSAWAKIYEKIEANRIAFWAKKEEILMKCQTGFVKGYDITDAWDNINDFLNRTDEKGQTTRKLIAKVDIKGAFDNVKPEDILDVLVKKRYPAQAIVNIAKYVTNRTNTLVLGEHIISRPKSKGTVQGAIFSPILFNVLMADNLSNFPQEMEDLAAKRDLTFFMSMYADDIIIILEHSGKGDLYNNGVNLLNAMTIVIEALGKKLSKINLEMSKEKTQATFWPNNTFLGLYDDTRNEKERKFGIRTNIKILGINVAPGKRIIKGAFDEHILDKIAEGNRILLTLKNNRKGSMKWKKTMIRSVIYQIIFYGAAIWSQGITETTFGKIESLLWKCNRFVAELDQNIPQKAVTVATGLPPAHLELQKVNFIELAKKSGLIKNGEWIPPPPKRTWLEYFHPANFPQFEYKGDFQCEADIPLCEEGEAHIYTDAALTKDGGGMAALNYRQEKYLLFKTTKWTNSFELEAKAICMALKHLNKLITPNIKKVTFLTDSKATVEALKNRKNDHHTINEIRSQIVRHENLGQTFAIAWVKGHRDIIGNQAADLMAMVASKIGMTILIPCTKGLINKTAEEELFKDWGKWYENGKNESMKKFFPTLDLAQKYLTSKETVLFFSSSLEWMRVYTSKLKSRKWNKIKHPNHEDEYCECDGESIQDAWHLIFHCQFLEEERRRLSESQGLNQMDLKEWSEGKKEKDKDFYHFITSMMPAVEPELEMARKVMKWLDTENRK